jgi:hypothetical protein
MRNISSPTLILAFIFYRASPSALILPNVLNAFDIESSTVSCAFTLECDVRVISYRIEGVFVPEDRLPDRAREEIE